MKILYLIRHAKSSWSFQLNDHTRPLGKRGRKDVRKMGKFLQKHVDPPEVLISSTASRAFYTSLHLADAWGIDESVIQLEPELYHSGNKDIIKIIKKAPDVTTLALFGHNPGFTDLAEELVNGRIDNIPTCGIVGIKFDMSSWKDIKKIKGEQLFFHYPKSII